MADQFTMNLLSRSLPESHITLITTLLTSLEAEWTSLIIK